VRIDRAGQPPRAHRVDERHNCRFVSGVVEHVGEPLVEVSAGAQHDRGAGHGLDVAWPWLVLVRVGVGLEDLRHRRAVARDIASKVADLGRRRDDAQAAI